MRYLLYLIMIVSLASCSNSELIEENAELRTKVEEYKLMAEQAAMFAKEAEAKALMALEEAEVQRMAAEQALQDCKGK